MSNPLQRRTISFVVRVWAEYLYQQPPSWRGSIEMCDQEEKIAFSSLEEMSRIIQRVTHLEIDTENPIHTY